MKHYTIPTVLLLAVSALLLFAALGSFGRASRSQRRRDDAQLAVEAARLDLAVSQKGAVAARERSAEADRFLKKWTDELGAESNIERVFGQLDTLAVNNLLSPSGKNFTLNMNYFFNGRHLPVQNVNITVAGDYSRTLNWLGAVESAFPMARVEQVSYTNNGNTLCLAVQFVFPKKFEFQ
jgi:hypothetical protein